MIIFSILFLILGLCFTFSYVKWDSPEHQAAFNKHFPEGKHRKVPSNLHFGIIVAIIAFISLLATPIVSVFFTVTTTAYLHRTWTEIKSRCDK